MKYKHKYKQYKNMKTIKNNIKSCLIVIAMLGTVSCSNLLDDTPLDTSIKVSDITVDRLPLLVRGMYVRFHNNTNIYGQAAFGEEIASDNLTSSYELSSVSSFTNFDACNVPVNDQLICGRMFSYPYNGIGAANVIINFVNNNGHTDAISRQAKGEALVFRGYCYMLLAERFGKAVITLGDKSDNVFDKQQPEANVWKQAENDFLEALTCLADYTTPDAASLQAAQALLARLYLNLGVLTSNTQMLADAGKYANLVITVNSALALSDNFKDNFVSASQTKEVIYRFVETVSAAQSSYQYRLLSPSSYANSYRGSTFMETSLVALYNEASDKRLATVEKAIYPTTNREETYCTKFSADKNPVWPIIRLSEVYLIAAEVKARQNIIDVTEFNILRSIRNSTSKQISDFPNSTAFLNEIENERRRELVGEGLRWMDMRRFNRIESHLENKGIDKLRVHFPIYSGEITNNPNLIQTDYYSR
jgi:hypothetical protein